MKTIIRINAGYGSTFHESGHTQHSQSWINIDINSRGWFEAWPRSWVGTNNFAATRYSVGYYWSRR